MAAITSKKHSAAVASPNKALKHVKTEKINWANMIVQLWTGISGYLLTAQATFHQKELVRSKLVCRSWNVMIIRHLPLNIFQANEPCQKLLAQIALHGDLASREKAEKSQAIIVSWMQTHGIVKPKSQAGLTAAARVTAAKIAELNEALAVVWKIQTETDARNYLRFFSRNKVSEAQLIQLECLIQVIERRHPSIVSHSRLTKILLQNPHARDLVLRAMCQVEKDINNMSEENLDWVGADESSSSAASSSSSSTAANHG